MVRKDRSTFVNKTYLLQMLPVFYQKHLKSQFNLAEYIFLLILITLLESIKKVSKDALWLPLYQFQLHLKVEERKYKYFYHYQA